MHKKRKSKRRRGRLTNLERKANEQDWIRETFMRKGHVTGLSWECPNLPGLAI